MSERVKICPHCGSWEIKPHKHQYCGGCGAYISDESLAVDFDGKKGLLFLNFNQTLRAAEHYELLNGGLVCVSSTGQSYESFELKPGAAGQLVAELPKRYESKPLFWVVGPKAVDPDFLPRPSGVVTSQDISQPTNWNGPAAPLRAIAGLTDLPVVLSSPVPVTGATAAVFYQVDGEVQKKSIQLSRLYPETGKQLSDITCGPGLPLKLTLAADQLKQILKASHELSFEVRDARGALIGQGPLRAENAELGEIEFKIRREVKVWGGQEDEISARIPYRIANTGGTPVEIKSFSLVAVAGHGNIAAPQASERAKDNLLGHKSWQNAGSDPITLPVNFKEAGELRPIPAKVEQSRVSGGVEVHRYSISFDWRPTQSTSDKWTSVREEITVLVRREARSALMGDTSARVCVDFGTTQSSAVLITGPLDAPIVQPIHLACAGMTEGREGDLFLDSAVAVNADDQWVFGQEATRLRDTERADDYVVVENLKWNLVGNSPISIHGKMVDHKQIAVRYLQHICALIKGHPDVGELVDEVIVTCPAEFGEPEEKALIEIFRAAGMKPMSLSFAGETAHLSESWPPIAWALSVQSDAVETVLTGGSEHFAALDGGAASPFVLPQGIIPEGQINAEDDASENVSWALTFDMGGGSTDLSIFRIAKRQNPDFDASEAFTMVRPYYLEISDEARATSSSKPNSQGFVGRSFEELVNDIVARRLAHLIDEQPRETLRASDRIPFLVKCLNDSARRLLWRKQDEQPTKSAHTIGVRKNAQRVRMLANAIRLDTGGVHALPLSSGLDQQMTDLYKGVIAEKLATLAVKRERFIEVFLDSVPSFTDFSSNVARLPSKVDVFNDQTGSSIELNLTQDWWIETIALMASKMFDYEAVVDDVLKRTLLPAARKSTTTIVLSGRAGMFSPARTFAFAKFQIACGINDLKDFRSKALNADAAKLITSLGGAYMGRIFDIGNQEIAKFKVNRATELGVQSGGFVALRSLNGTHPKRGPFVYFKAKGLGNFMQLFVRNSAGHSVQKSALVTLTEADRISTNSWIVLERDGQNHLAGAWCVQAESEHQAVDMVTNGGGIALDFRNPQ